jgi:hypothetical protein
VDAERRTAPAASGTDGAGPRDLLADRRVLADSVLPPVVFVVANAAAGLTWASGASLALAAGLLAYRLARGQRLLYAASGLGGVVVGVGLALLTRDAAGYFLPGIVTNATFAVACVLSILLRRPLIALTSAAIYGWPLRWYWHPRVRPAYSEITWAWAALYAGKALLQAQLARSGELGWLAFARVATGWPAFALLLLASYAYVNRRLARLDGPPVEAFRHPEP